MAFPIVFVALAGAGAFLYSLVNKANNCARNYEKELQNARRVVYQQKKIFEFEENKLEEAFAKKLRETMRDYEGFCRDADYRSRDGREKLRNMKKIVGEDLLKDFEKLKDLATQINESIQILRNQRQAEKDFVSSLKEMKAEIKKEIDNLFKKNGQVKKNCKTTSKNEEKIKKLFKSLRNLNSKIKDAFNLINGTKEELSAAYESLNEKRNEIREFKEEMLRFTCRECGESFYLTYGEIMFYVRKGLYLPERCDVCRKRKS